VEADRHLGAACCILYRGSSSILVLSGSELGSNQASERQGRRGRQLKRPAIQLSNEWHLSSTGRTGRYNPHARQRDRGAFPARIAGNFSERSKHARCSPCVRHPQPTPVRLLQLGSTGRVGSQIDSIAATLDTP
jgi:hypothetical protein